MIVRWAAAVTGAIGLALGGEALGLPSPALLGGLVAGLVCALAAGWVLDPPAVSVRGSQGVLGVSIGALVQSETLSEVGGHAVPVLLVGLATLALSVGAGLALARWTGLDRPTAAFGMIAGGASGIVAIADELGADNRLVAVMQYLRVLVIIALTPVIAVALYPAGDGGKAVAALDPTTLEALATLAVCLTVGVPLARASRLPAGVLLGPMICAAALSLTGAGFAGPPPGLVLDAAFLVIGGQVGLRFTPDSVRAAGSLLLPGLVIVLALMAACAGCGVALAEATGRSAVDGYLATTPGGLYAVLAAGVDADADLPFVLAVQVVRVFVMLLAAPAVAKRLTRHRGDRPFSGA